MTLGGSLGLSVPIGTYKELNTGGAEAGVAVNLIDFNYNFFKNFGLAASYVGILHPYALSPTATWTTAGMNFGPTFTIPISSKFSFNAGPKIGFAISTFATTNTGNNDINANSTTYSFNGNLHYLLKSRLSLYLKTEYFECNPIFEQNGLDLDIKVINIATGVAFKF